MPDSSLATSVSSRICHDLVSPIGAIVNGVDLVREMGAGEHAEAIGMIGQSAERASALLQLYRIAFGAAEADSTSVPRGLLAEHSAVLFTPPRIVIEWDGRAGPALPRREARLLSLLLLCARSILGMRGSVLLRTGMRAPLPLTLAVMTENFSSTVDLLDLLADGGAGGRGSSGSGSDGFGGQVSPRSVEFVLARHAARDLNVRLELERTAGRVTISTGA
jgi:histidine phosphotransferase ChpT